MTGKPQNEVIQEEVTLEEVIEEVEDQLGDMEAGEVKDGVLIGADTEIDEVGDEASIETETEEATPEITIESLAEEIESLKSSAADSLDKAVRAQAELDNVRKRATRDVENAHKYALDKFINELLPVLDSMELGINASTDIEDVSSLREGMELTMKMFCSSLEKSGVNPVSPQKGDKFNPEQHEAVTMQEEENTEPGAVISTLQKGYELNGRLIRPAMVIVAK